MQKLLFIRQRRSASVNGSQACPIFKSIRSSPGKAGLVASIAAERWEKTSEVEEAEWVGLGRGNAWELFVLNAKFRR